MTDHPGHGRPRDTGSTSITMAIIFPTVAVLVLAFAQAALIAAARNVALASAEEGLRIARARNATPAQGQAAAADFAAREPVLLSPTVTITAGTTIEVRVRGHAPSLLPGVQLSINETARGARERFTVETPQP
jgi:hypothetical protein